MSTTEFAAKPVLHIVLERFDINSEAYFKATASSGKGVIEGTTPREAPHAEAVKPLNRARPGLVRRQNLYFDLSSKHDLMLLHIRDAR
jgi:hypothetical protein